ncbi:hypothetical protein [Christensenella intestinihominis]|uniref:hypothetical protein n=1 Tax=Christensenella intestinihominis TaxID=1851429 RepID=UPI00082EC37D|nr:hypothetical protein [Christensenella intestinihominis]
MVNDIKKELLRFFCRPEVIIILIATVLRIILANMAGIWFPSSAGEDDRLLVEYAILPGHFGAPNIMSLVKTMSFPLFLDFVHLTGMTYSTVITIFWIVAAVLAVYCFRQINSNRWFLLFTYLFILFTPAAFDVMTGTRLYRNAIIVPFVFICFLLMLIILFKTIQNKNLTAKDILCPSIFLGFFFLFTYYIKEDGIWLLPCLCLAIFVVILISVIRFAKKQKGSRRTNSFVRLTATFLVPLIIFSAGTELYKAINLRYFGVAEINTRTEGELGKFVSNVYKIESEKRTTQIWAPYDAIQKAFDASPTLQEYPDLEDQIMHTPWFSNDIVQDPIPGDFLTWVLRTALKDTGIWQSEKQMNDLFAKVNTELAAAFENGELQKDNSFQISASGGGRTFDEILQLKTPIKREYESAVFLNAYEPGGKAESDYTDPASCEYATLLTHTNLLWLNDTTIKVAETETANRVISLIFKIYSVLNPLLLVLAAIGFVTAIIRLIRRKKNKMKKTDCNLLLGSVLTMFVLFGIGFMYAFSIAWFSEFVWLRAGMDDWILKFYSIGLVPLLSLFYLFGLSLFTKNLAQVITTRRSKKNALAKPS